MPTINQLLRKPRQRPRKRVDLALLGAPQKRAVVVRAYVVKPKKPNSALRKVCQVRLKGGKLVICYIPGESHRIMEHATVLIRGGGPPDLPGVKYSIIRGAQDVAPVAGRRQSRSRYGTKRPQ